MNSFSIFLIDHCSGKSWGNCIVQEISNKAQLVQMPHRSAPSGKDASHLVGLTAVFQ